MNPEIPGARPTRHGAPFALRSSHWRPQVLDDHGLAQVLPQRYIDRARNHVRKSTCRVWHGGFKSQAQRSLTCANIVRRDRMVPAADCGFGTFADVGAFHPPDCFVKLARMVVGAGAELTQAAEFR